MKFKSRLTPGTIHQYYIILPNQNYSNRTITYMKNEHNCIDKANKRGIIRTIVASALATNESQIALQKRRHDWKALWKTSFLYSAAGRRQKSRAKGDEILFGCSGGTRSYCKLYSRREIRTKTRALKPRQQPLADFAVILKDFFVWKKMCMETGLLRMQRVPFRS